jgi:hypothetical protein
MFQDRKGTFNDSALRMRVCDQWQLWGRIRSALTSGIRFAGVRRHFALVPSTLPHAQSSGARKYLARPLVPRLEALNVGTAVEGSIPSVSQKSRCLNYLGGLQ